jgi:hypothetical protein
MRGSDLPGVLRVGVEVVAADGRGADVRAVGEVRRARWPRCKQRAAGEKAGERVRERIAGVDVVGSALRRDEFSGIGGSAAEVVFAVGADAEVGGVAIDADFEAGLNAWVGGEGDVLAALEEIAVGLHHRAGAELKASKRPSLNLTAGSV